MRWTVTSLAAAVAVSTFHASEVPQQQPPAATFRSGVELITLEASVRDGKNEPVTDLQPADFTITIDGKPRPVVFAHLVRSEPAPIVASSGAIVPRHATNEDAVAGQILVLVVDRNAFPSGYERAIQATASRLLDRLSPADAVGLVQIPGPIVDVTRDHTRVADALKSIVGNSPTRATRHTVSWDEAIAFERGQKFIKATVYARECRFNEPTCSQDVDLAAAEVRAFGRSHAQVLLPALSSMIRGLAPLRAPKHLVLLSSGVVFDAEFVDRFKEIERAAAEARVTIETIRLQDFKEMRHRMRDLAP